MKGHHWMWATWAAAVAAIVTAVHAEPLLQASFEQGAGGWKGEGLASVSEISRRPGTRSLLLQQGTNAGDAASCWLSPPVAASGHPLKLTFWAADNYLVCPDLSYSACLDLVGFDEAGKTNSATLGLIPITWDDGRVESLWGQKLQTGLTWRYYERIIQPPGKTFRILFHWPKPLARGDCSLTDLLLTPATAEERAADVASATPADAATSLPYRMEILPVADAGLYRPDEPLQFDVALFNAGTNNSAIPADGALAYEITDFQRFFIARGRVALSDPALASPTNPPAVKPGKAVSPPDVRRILTIAEPKAKETGREFFIEVKWLRDGQTAAADTVPYGVVNPRTVPPEDYTNCHFVIGYFDHAGRGGSIGEKMGACWDTRYEYGGWKEEQPVEGGPITFKEKMPAFPRVIWCPNMEQLRGRQDNHPWGSIFTGAPGWAIEPDPRTPKTKTFKIDPYVRYMVAFIRQNRAAIGMVVPSGLEREVDERTIELQKKAYTAIKKEFPDLPVGMMLYGMPMNPNTQVSMFLKEKLYEYADFIDDDIYCPAIDWTAWKHLQEEIKRLQRPPLPFTATEFALVGGTDQIQKSRDMITSQLDGFAHGMTLIHYWNMPGDPHPTYLREAPEGDGFMFIQHATRPRHGGDAWMPLLLTLTYYNLVQDFETAVYRDTFRPGENAIGYRFDRRNGTVMAMWLTQPLGALTYAVHTDAPFTTRDLFGRTDRLTPVNGVALISVDDNPLTLIFDRAVDSAIIRPVAGGVARVTLARGATGGIGVDVPGVFGSGARLSVSGTVDGTWPAIPAQTVTLKDGQALPIRVQAAIETDRAVGVYPIAFQLRDGDRLAGVLKGELRVDQRMDVGIEGVPWTRATRPAVRVSVRNLQAGKAQGTVIFDDRYFADGLRSVVSERPYRLAAGESTAVEFPVDPRLMVLASAYEVGVEVHDASGIDIRKTEEVAFRACEKAPGPIAVDGDLKDWNPAARTAFAFERKHTNWGKKFTGPDDLGGSFYTAWDSNNLYFAAVIRDDIPINRANDVGIWEDDNIMLGLYPWGWKLGECVHSGYYREHMGLCGDGTSRVFRVGCIPGGPATSEGVRIKVVRTEGGYIYEWAYPRASVFPLELRAGSRFRLSLWVWDKDDSKGPLGGIQTGGFDTVVDARPTKWREFVLTE